MEIGSFPREWDRIFNPETIAVVGASNFPGKWGFVMPMSILGGGYRGELFMVNPTESRVLGMRAYPSLLDIGSDIDLVIVTIPAVKIPDVIRDAAEKGIKNVLVVASNFSEASEEGAKLEREVAHAANEAGITIIGPNTMGIVSAPASLCALGAPAWPLKGGVGFISQSGNLGVQLLTWGKKRGIGFSRFVGSGNEANTEMTDFLSFLGDDPETRAIALYMEGLEDGRRFLEVARRITPRKPVVVLKGGKGEQGARAVRSHSGAMAGQLELFEGMFEQAGVIVAETSAELLDLVTAFTTLPLPPGGRVAVMTMGGGWGVVASDASDREGVDLVKLPPELIEELDMYLPRYWSHGNPVDVVGNLRRTNHFRVIEALVNSKDVDLLIVMGAMLGKDFFVYNLLNTMLRPFYYIARRRPALLPAFMTSLREGFRHSVSERDAQNPIGSVGINPAELYKWTDGAMIHELKDLMSRTGKPIISVTMSEMKKSVSAPPGSKGVFETPTPERAVFVASKLVKYARFVREALI